MGGWTGGQTTPSIPLTPTHESTPDRLRGATQDLFELLERVQCSRLDDQRCVLPAYFSQVRTFLILVFIIQNILFKYFIIFRVFTVYAFIIIFYNIDDDG